MKLVHIGTFKKILVVHIEVLSLIDARMDAPIPPKYTKRDERKAVQQSTVKIHCRLQDLIDAQGMTRTALSQATGLTSAAIRG